jgi:hypothetical protein
VVNSVSYRASLVKIRDISTEVTGLVLKYFLA